MKTITAFLCALALSPSRCSPLNTPRSSHDELKSAIKEKKVTLLDVNGTDTYKEGHIPGAIDFTQAKAELKSKLPADKSALVVAYCGNENCPAYAAGAKAAQELGYTNVKHYKWGIAGWKAKARRLRRARNRALEDANFEPKFHAPGGQKTTGRFVLANFQLRGRYFDLWVQGDRSNATPRSPWSYHPAISPPTSSTATEPWLTRCRPITGPG
jgi:rhodanese-related sulfurtransferase